MSISAGEKDRRDPSPPIKRSRRTLACDECARSKSRCSDVIQPLGCLRCRQRQTSCSLSGTDGTAAFSAASSVEPAFLRPSNHLSDLENRVFQLERELMDARIRLEKQEHDVADLRVSGSKAAFAASMPSALSQGPSTGYGAAPTPTDRPNNRFQNPNYTVGRMEAPLFSSGEWTFTLADCSRFPDPVALGMVSPDAAEATFQMFKHRFSHLSTLPSFIPPWTGRPSHPFILTAVLWFTSPSASIAKLVEDSVMLVMTGAAVYEAVIALYILSLSPAPADEDLHSLSPLRLISLATSIGQALNLDAVEQQTCSTKNPSNLLAEVWESHLERTLVWQTVKNRHNILTILQGRSPHTLTLQALPPAPPTTKYQFWQVRARVEEERNIVDICRPILQSICVAELGFLDDRIPFVWNLRGDWQKVNDRMNEYIRKLDPSARSVRADALALVFTLIFRISRTAQNLPSPLLPVTRWGAASDAGTQLILRQSALLAFFLDDMKLEPHSTPAHILVILGLCVFISYRTISYIVAHAPNVSHLVEESSTHRAAMRLRQHGGHVVKIIDSFVLPAPQQHDAGPFSAYDATAGPPIDGDLAAMLNEQFPDGLWAQIFGLDPSIQFTT